MLKSIEYYQTVQASNIAECPPWSVQQPPIYHPLVQYGPLYTLSVVIKYIIICFIYLYKNKKWTKLVKYLQQEHVTSPQKGHPPQGSDQNPNHI